MKDTNKFAETLLTWIKEMLTTIGLPKEDVDQWDITIYLILIIIIAITVGRFVHWFTVYSTERILKYKQVKILSTIIEYSVLKKLSWIIPPVIVGALLPFAFENRPTLLSITERITWIYFMVVVLISTNVIATSVQEIMMSKTGLQNRPLKGIIQIIQVLLWFMGVMIIVSILVNKSPLNLLTGLGAFAAVIMLIFKDSILGFVAGVQLSQNDMIHIGDWIEVPGTNVNGTVMDISLNTVKIQNFDNTTATIPPYSLVSGSFINWRGMTQSEGRRIMRCYPIKLDHIQTCTPEYLEKMKQIDLLKDYITQKQAEKLNGHEANTDNSNGLVNGTIETNLGLFRAYMTLYLKQHPFINQDLTLMIRTLDPTPNGIPLQVYCFSSNKNWVSFESIQAEVMEHFVANLPKFDLYPFQNVSSRDEINNGLLEAGVHPDLLYGVPWNTLKKEI